MKLLVLLLVLNSVNPSSGCFSYIFGQLFPQSVHPPTTTVPPQWPTVPPINIPTLPKLFSVLPQIAPVPVTDPAPTIQLPKNPFNLSAMGIQNDFLQGLLNPLNDVINGLTTNMQNVLDVLKSLNTDMYNDFDASVKDLQKVLTTDNISSPAGLVDAMDALSHVLSTLLKIMDSTVKLNIPANEMPFFTQLHDNLYNLSNTINAVLPVLKLTTG